ncbi:TetR/AcrR family transcriptional regulator [Kribbella sp. NPDC006257]|uniref:TetR/AcrR family transcriptional regulator n=1 Tax=Kribbella sp. NPDC006257 TaxID=3156738 RepID=UPI0033A9B9CF
MTDTRRDVRAKIIDVAAQLLREQGPAAVTTRGVAQGAGVQAPTIYRLFGDKDGLLEAVAEHVMASYVSSKAAIVASASADGVDPLDDLRAGWQAQIDFGLANPAIFRLLSDPDRVLHSAAAESGLQVLRTRVRRIAEAGRLRVSEQRAMGLIQAAGVGAIQVLLTTPPEQRDLGLPDEIFDAVLRQILTDTPPSAQSGAVTSAVALRAITPDLEMLSPAERVLLGEWLDRAIDKLQT